MPEHGYTIDFFSIFIFLGIIQGLFLSFFYFIKKIHPVNIYQGFLFLSISAVSFEIFMMYSGYIQHAFFLVDFSESLGLALGPLFYAVVLGMIYGNTPKRFGIHFIPFIIYSFMLLPFLLLPDVAKYNAWVMSYHPEWETIQYDYPYSVNFLGVRDNISLITILHIGLYGFLCLYEVVNVFRSAKESIFKTKKPAWQSLRLIPFYALSVILFVLIVKLINQNDTGDHLFAAYISFVVYLSTFNLLRTSTLLTSSIDQGDKYGASRLSESQQNELLHQLDDVMRHEKWYARHDSTLPGLANRLGTTVHQLSQAINNGLNKTYFDVLAEYRTNEAKRLLKSEEGKLLKLEEVAERVGYNSKSSFNSAFKKLTGATPSQYRDQ